MDASIGFYESQFGMKLFSRREIKESNAEIAFVGYDEQGMRLELTHWRSWGPDEYTEGSQFDHIAIVVADLDATMARLRAAGVKVAKEPTKLSIGSRIAFVLDLDGNWVELIERKDG